jgi:tetratricopeptide (TPR) repeat protein
MVESAVAVILLWTVWLCSHTWQRQYDWADQRTFLTRTIEAGGDSARMRVNLGNLELSEGKPERALAEYDSALARDPKLVFAHFGRAAAYVRLGDATNARAALERCGTGHLLEAEITQIKAALDSSEKKSDPIPGYKTAADLAPLNWYHRKRYLTALAESGRLKQAIQEVRAFLDVQPFRADSWLLLANLLTRSGQRDAAAMVLTEARLRDVHLQAGPPAENEARAGSP